MSVAWRDVAPGMGGKEKRCKSRLPVRLTARRGDVRTPTYIHEIYIKKGGASVGRFFAHLELAAHFAQA
jgi:hypothetical protein